MDGERAVKGRQRRGHYEQPEREPLWVGREGAIIYRQVEMGPLWTGGERAVTKSIVADTRNLMVSVRPW